MRPSIPFSSLLAASIAASPFVVPMAAQAERPQVELILDASGSMWNKLDDGRFRITAAKEVLGDFVALLPRDGLDVGLRIYGSRVAAKEEGSCLDTVLVRPIDGVDGAALQAAVRDARAVGATPIALSLREAAEDLAARPAGQRLVVLVTDGEEACGGDVAAAAAALRATGADVDLRIVGLGLDAAARKSFSGLGSFENVRDAKELAGALGRAVVAVVPEMGDATLAAPDRVPAGTSFDVAWTGDGATGDYVTLVTADAEDGAAGTWAPTERNPVRLTAPLAAGDYELRYQSDRTGGVAGRRALVVEPADVGLSTPVEVPAGQPFGVEWIGPNGEGDYVTLVPAEAEDGSYEAWLYTADAPSPASFHAPLRPGEYEARYQSERAPSLVLARAPFRVLPPEIAIGAPEVVQAGASFAVPWAGPDGDSDYLTIVPVGTEDGVYHSWAYTRDGNPLTLEVPFVAGAYEVRYQSERESGVFGRARVRVVEPSITLEAPATVEAGSTFEVRWTGPDGSGNYLTIVARDAGPAEYGDYAYTSEGSPVRLTAPGEPGTWEIRFNSERDTERVFGRRTIEVR